ncbi:MAG: hypothetical protein ACRD2Y_03335 [Terriglobales bacterium]
MSASKSQLTKGIAVMLSIAAGLIGVIVFSFLLVFGAPKDKEAAAALGERPYWHFLAAAASVFAITFGGLLATLLSYMKLRKKKDEGTAEITSPSPEQQSESPPQ